MLVFKVANKNPDFRFVDNYDGRSPISSRISTRVATMSARELMLIDVQVEVSIVGRSQVLIGIYLKI
ncbi:hypothetical protein F2Q69_00006002 [Brassica cretica]|uniref:Uncharacterized protein n=1 Tax=Brassica cretica TaxID=69181 RepID=A0A8S9PII9_BRACR|nr:hypothetical protein F2Q69_00006002 [Brassica cretica]